MSELSRNMHEKKLRLFLVVRICLTFVRTCKKHVIRVPTLVESARYTSETLQEFVRNCKKYVRIQTWIIFSIKDLASFMLEEIKSFFSLHLKMQETWWSYENQFLRFKIKSNARKWWMQNVSHKWCQTKCKNLFDHLSVVHIKICKWRNVMDAKKK